MVKEGEMGIVESQRRWYRRGCWCRARQLGEVLERGWMSVKEKERILFGPDELMLE